MPSTSYYDADGTKKYRSVQGTGTAADPYVADVNDSAGATSIGGQSDAPVTTPTATGSLISSFRGFWTAFGLVSQASDTTGTLMQRIRGLGDRLGSFGDAANATGSIMAQLRLIAENHLIPNPTKAQYYASFAGGNKSYNATAGVQNVTSAGGLISVFQNPTGSGLDMYVQRLVMSGDQPGRFERYRGGTINVTGAAAPANNRGGNGTPGAGKVYGRSSATASGGTIGVVTYIPASGTYGDMVDATLVLRPGQAIYWNYFPNVGVSGSSNCAVEVVWWELPAQA